MTQMGNSPKKKKKDFKRDFKHTKRYVMASFHATLPLIHYAP